MFVRPFLPVIAGALVLVSLGLPGRSETVRAGFDGRERQPDSWRGVPGDGWASPWYIHVRPSVGQWVTGFPRGSTDAPFNPASPRYVEAALCPIPGAELTENARPYLHIARKVAPEVIDPRRPHQVRLMVRLENRWKAWGTGSVPELNISGRLDAHRNPLWQLRATPEGWSFSEGNPIARGGWVESGLPAELGETVAVVVNVDPEAERYDVRLSAGGKTVEKQGLSLPKISQENPALFVRFSQWLGHEEVRGGMFSFDEIEIEQPIPPQPR